MNTNIMEFRPQDRIFQDAEPIALIYRSMGAKAAEEVVSRALSELAVIVSGMAQQVRANNLVHLSRQLRRLERMSAQLGLTSLGRVSADLRTCLDGEDATAFAAVWARLVRVAERSLACDNGAVDQQI